MTNRKNSLMGRIVLLVFIALFIGIITSCTLSSPSGSSGSGELVYEDMEKNIEFSWWGTDARHRYNIEGLERFSMENPDIRVNVNYGAWDGFERRNRIALKSKSAADVMLINYSWLDEYSSDGEGYYDLSTLSDEIDFSQFSEEDLSYGMRNGKLNAIPIAYNTTVFIYNKSLYDKYGLEIPKTWSDLYDCAERMNKDGIYPMGMVKKHFFLTMVAYYEQESGMRFFTSGGRLNVNVDGIKEILKFYKRLVDNGVMKPVGEFDMNSFLNGESAGAAVWVNDAVKYGEYLEERNRNVECGIFMTIDGKDFRGWYKKPATMYAMSNISKNPKESARLINFLLNDEDFAKQQGVEKGFPISRKANKAVVDYCDIPEFALEANDLINGEKYNLVTMPSEMENVDIINAFEEGADKYVYGEENLNICAAEIIKAVRESYE